MSPRPFVLLVEDNPITRKLVRFAVQQEAIDLAEAEDGKTALEIAEARRPDLILQDLLLPDMSGFELADRLRARPQLQSVPILAFSGLLSQLDEQRISGSGFTDVVTKPIEPSKLVRTIRAHLPSADTPQPSFVAQCATLSAELAVLNAISEAITHDADINVVLREILAACCDAAGVSTGALYLATPDKSFRTLIVGTGRTDDAPDVFLGDGVRLRRLIDGRKAVLISRDSAERDYRDWLDRNGLQSALVVPLQHKDDMLGALVMMSDAADLGTDDRMLFAESVGHQVSVALALTQAFEDTAMAAEAARQQATLLQSVFSSITDPIVVLDTNSKPSTWNAAAEELFEISSHRDAPFTTDETARRIGLFKTDKATVFPSAERPLGQALKGDAVEGVAAYLKNPRRPDGAWLNISARPMVGDDGTVYGAVSVNRDVTSERLANEHMMISDRMASIGMIAAGVGHEINNPLCAVVAGLELAAAEIAGLARDIGPARLGDLPDEINEALAAAQRVRQIAADLKVFSDGQREENGPTDVERVLDSSLRMARNQVRHRAKVVKRYGNVPLATGVEPRLGQVFLNLIVNAAQAIPEGALDRHAITLTTRVEADGRIVTDVEDTGSGIPPELKAQLFTPFVTSKPAGVGTGLGLSICQRLVTAMGGTIWADSTPGKGTVFHVALPPAAAARTRTASGTWITPAVAKPSAKARILVIDDEDMIGNILRRVLRPHDVTVLTNAKDALAQITAGVRFDAILCDLMMPGMSGIEFHQALTREHPGQVGALMFLTGGAFSNATATFLESVDNPCLEKPFDVPNLRAVVDRHIATRGAAHRPSGDRA